MGFFEAIDRDVAPMVRALNQRARRHAVISANMANVDTPGYRTVDVSFDQALERSRLALSTTDPRHMKGAPVRGADRVVLSGGTPRRDGNDVNVDREMVKLARNQIEYQFFARTLGRRFQRLREAITGRAT